MLTYTPPQDPNLAKPTEKPWLLLLLTFIWLWPGIIGHDPWKPVEPFATAVVQGMLSSHNWLLPTTQGIPHLESPPLYYWVAAGFVKLFSPWLLTMPDAARLATPFFMAIALTLMGGAGRLLIGRRHGRSVVLILIGCIGLIATGHQMNPIVAGFAGFAAAFYALALALTSPGLAGAILGVGLVVTFLSTSLLEVVLIASVAALLPAFSAWRNKSYAITLILALLIAVPLALIWPMAFAKVHPAEFAQWWNYYALGPLNGIGHISLFHELGYYPKVVFWYCFPAWPLAAWALHRRRDLNSPMLQLPLMFFAVVLILLTLSDRQAPEYAMPLLLPMALMAAVELDTLKRGAAALFNWFGLMTFGFFGILVWLGWLAMNYGWPAKLAERSAYFSPYYQPQVSTFAAVCALIASLVWVWAVTRRNLRGRQAVTNWAAGITLLWGLGLTLWLPWLDAAKSFRPVVEQMVDALPPSVSCVATEDRNRLARLSWEMYGDMKLKTFPKGSPDVPCNWRLRVVHKNDGLAEPGWTLMWSGSRPRDDIQFGLYQRTPSVAQR
ncbi:hypothetical protein OL229_06820 [Neisseriaceae bacterium JH1-16]|nr:hypothetical protein [Neisseriaceae bacterium JH1-16]